MSMSELHAKVDAFESKLRALDHTLIGEFRQLVDHLLGETKADAAQLATDAETAAKPVIAEAEHDAAALGETAATEATQAAAAGLSPQSAPAAAPTTEASTSSDASSK
jgi:hypothetical protein